MKRASILLIVVLTLAVFGMAQRAGALDGAALYSQNCAGCHGSLAASNVAGATAKSITDAINNSKLPMSGLKGLSAAEIKAIADALSPSLPPFQVDTTPPTITSFILPATSSSLTVTIQSLAASDNVGVTGFVVKESSAPPGASDSSWTGDAPSTYTFISEGTKTLYAWAKDAAGNVSNSVSAQVTISLSNPTPQPPSEVDLTIWKGQWLKVAIKYEGYSFGNSGSRGSSDVPKLGQDRENIVVYLKFVAWNPLQSTLQGELYQLDSSGQWTHDPLTLHFVGGTATDFLCWSQEEGDFAFGFSGRIQGKDKGGVLKSGTLKTLGGYYLDVRKGEKVGSPEFLAGEISINGSLVSRSKVPVVE